MTAALVKSMHVQLGTGEDEPNYRVLAITGPFYSGARESPQPGGPTTGHFLIHDPDGKQVLRWVKAEDIRWVSYQVP